jgi:U2-associated protein SR140
MGNALFDFLHDTTSPDHTYYRWRAYSLAQGDELQNFRTAKFQMYQNGPMWQPPACPIKHTETEEGSRIFSEGVAGSRMNGSKQTHQSEAKERGRVRDRDRDEDREERARQRERDSDGRGRILDGQLSARQLDSLHGILRSLVVDRKSIEEGLMFCVDHSEAADEIVSWHAAPILPSSLSL